MRFLLGPGSATSRPAAWQCIQAKSGGSTWWLLRDPRRVPIARCECGEYGRASTDVNIVREGEVVHWDWLIGVPMRQGVTFKAPQYDAEVARIGSDQCGVLSQIEAVASYLDGCGADRVGPASAALAGADREPSGRQVEVGCARAAPRIWPNVCC